MSSFHRANFGAQKGKLQTGQEPVNISLTGWNNASAAECVAFVLKKTRVQISNYHAQQAVLHGTVKNHQDAQSLLQYSGVRFAGQPLKFKIEESASNSNSNSNTREVLTNFLKSRYDPASQFLNLSGVQHDPAVQSIGFFRSAGTAARFFPALMLVAEQVNLEVSSADLSGNEISDLEWVSVLPKSFPRLRNLSLQNNRLGTTKPFDSWKKKLVHLRELLIDGNPFMNRVQPQELKNQFRRIFPRLIVLNGEIVRNEEVTLANYRLGFESPQAIFFQDAEVQNISTGFITNFISLWDSDRTALMGLFQPQSQFSLQVDSSTPHALGNAQVPDFGSYLSQSRNLSKVSAPKARMTKLAIGQEQIYTLFSQIPKSKHDLINKPSEYSMEAYKLPQMGAICITLHGSFTEVAPPANIEKVTLQSHRFKNGGKKQRPQLGSKSFDRTFIVIPGANNSMIVASDMLCLRAEVEPDAFTGTAPAPITPQPTVPAQPTPVNAGNATAIPGALPSPASYNLPEQLKGTLNQIQQELLVKVLMETKLTVDYGLMLCQQSNWDYQQCVVNFSNSSASLPPNAFAQN